MVTEGNFQVQDFRYDIVLNDHFFHTFMWSTINDNVTQLPHFTYKTVEDQEVKWFFQKSFHDPVAEPGLNPGSSKEHFDILNKMIRTIKSYSHNNEW